MPYESLAEGFLFGYPVWQIQKQRCIVKTGFGKATKHERPGMATKKTVEPP